jgi:hypothetical protein
MMIMLPALSTSIAATETRLLNNIDFWIALLWVVTHYTLPRAGANVVEVLLSPVSFSSAGHYEAIQNDQNF